MRGRHFKGKESVRAMRRRLDADAQKYYGGVPWDLDDTQPIPIIRKHNPRDDVHQMIGIALTLVTIVLIGLTLLMVFGVSPLFISGL